jgi:hypothetical protein
MPVFFIQDISRPHSRPNPEKRRYCTFAGLMLSRFMNVGHVGRDSPQPPHDGLGVHTFRLVNERGASA